MMSDRGSNNLLLDKSTWKTTLIRWFFWILTTAASLVNIWLLYSVFTGFLHQWAVYATDVEMRKPKSDPTWNPTGPINVEYGWRIIGMVIVALLAIAYTVIDEVYLRRGELKGEMWKRIGIMVGAQVGLFVILYVVLLATGFRPY